MYKKTALLLLFIMFMFCGCTKPEKISQVNTLDNIIKRGEVIIGVKTDTYPFGYKDKNGKYDKPYIFMVAAGSNATGTRMSQYDKFTLYYAMYMETKNSKPWYYYNGEWTTVNPTNKQMLFDKTDLNRVKEGPLKGKQLQYYVIVNKPNWSLMSGTFWNEIKKISD